MSLTRILIFILISMLNAPIYSAIVNPEKRWPQNSILNVWFLDGSQSQHQLVQSTASRWSHYSNIKFEFFSKQPPENTHIRISFNGYDGSILGDHGDYSGTDPTIRLASVAQKNISIPLKRRIILHEFGHILGLEHEFLHPHWPYGNNWLKHQQQLCEERLATVLASSIIAESCQQLNTQLTDTGTWWFPFDEYSIMMYPVNSEWLAGRTTSIARPMSLSGVDKLAIALSYPKSLLPKSQISGHSSNTLLVDNHCNQAISLSIKFHNQVSKPLHFSLRAYERSERLKLNYSNILMMIDAPYAQHKWSKRWLRLNLNHAHADAAVLPIYCR